MDAFALNPDRLSPPQITGFTNLSLPSFQVSRLSNGIELRTLDSGDEEICRVALMWPLGTLDSKSPEAVSLMMNLLAEGCEGLSGEEINGILEENGAWLKTTVALHSTLIVLQTLNHTADEVFPVLASIIESPTFPEESFISIRNKTASEKEVASRKPAYQATVLSRKEVYGDKHPMSRLVTSETILATTIDAVKEAYQNILRSTPPIVFISGHLTETLLETLTTSLGKIEFNAQGRARRVISAPPLEENLLLKKEMPDSLQTGVRIHIPTIWPEHPDYEALRFATTALGGYFGSRLMSNIREDKGYTYGISALLNAIPEGASIIISCECDNAYAEAVLTEIEKEINRLASEPLEEEEMKIIKNVLISSMAGILDSPFYISGYTELMESNNLPLSLFSRQFREITQMTPQRVMQATAKYIRDARHVTVLAGGKPG